MNDSTEEPLFFMSVPQEIEADWDIDFASRLAGFPLNLLYTSVRWGKLESCCYWFDPQSYVEDGEKRAMTYYPKVKSPYWVMVECDKEQGGWQTRKYKGGDVVGYAAGPTFDHAMMQTTMAGLQPDEPVDDETEQ